MSLHTIWKLRQWSFFMFSHGSPPKKSWIWRGSKIWLHSPVKLTLSCRLVVPVAPRPVVTGSFDVRNLPEEFQSFTLDVLIPETKNWEMVKKEGWNLVETISRCSLMRLLWVSSVAIVWQSRPVWITYFSRLCHYYVQFWPNSKANQRL